MTLWSENLYRNMLKNSLIEIQVDNTVKRCIKGRLHDTSETL